MNYLFYNLRYIIITLVINIYQRRIRAQENKIREIRDELDFQVENYRSLLYAARKWAVKIQKE